MVTYESRLLKLHPTHWMFWTNYLHNAMFPNGIECCLHLTLLASSVVTAEGHTSSQTRLVVQRALHFQGSKSLPFLKCENCDLEGLRKLTTSVWLVGQGGPWKLGLLLSSAAGPHCPKPALGWAAAGLCPQSSSSHSPAGWSHAGQITYILTASKWTSPTPSSPLHPRCVQLSTPRLHLACISEALQTLSWMSVPSLTPNLFYPQ